MKQSELFPKTLKTAPKDAESINHQLLVRGGFIDQLMAGSWTLLPLGFRVVQKIIGIVREEMNAVGGQEMLMPLMHPKAIWNETGRWDKAREVMYQFKDTRDKEFALSFTHEEIVMDLIRKTVKSYQDLPLSVYHFSTKFRNEPRPRSGILRGREFLMKDLYSAHTTEADMADYYEKVKKAYIRVFDRLGFNFRVIEASGGVFTDKVTHEFQVLSDGGEDTVYYCDQCDFGQNKEIFTGKKDGKCPSCKKGKIVEAKAIEVGNIFPLGTWYSERMRVYYADEKGMKKPVWFASYGIGITRILGSLVEVSHDDKGIIWSPQIAPFAVHLIELPGGDKAETIYKKLQEEGIEVLFDDRAVSAGEKFGDADLIGIPVRLVVSAKTGDRIEYKERNKADSKLLSFDEVVLLLKK
jgi:prolyl-tRNA synthetase